MGIRFAKRRDAASIIKIAKLCGFSDFPINIRAVRSGISNKQYIVYYKLCFFGEDCNLFQRVFGFAWGGLVDHLKNLYPHLNNLNKDYFYLKLVAVHPDSQKKSIGSMLVKHALGMMRQLGYEGLYADTLNTNRPAVSILQKNGFKQIQEFTDMQQKKRILFCKEFSSGPLN
ncbi:GNAT family N-acetyltransferase [Candidatus Woesearchaeota archaeon]|nr:GNAT family N-acetyltransferase [Candidatus Woesearchaeota archaeon]